MQSRIYEKCIRVNKMGQDVENRGHYLVLGRLSVPLFCLGLGFLG